MALKYINLEKELSSIEVGILKKIGLKVINKKLFIDEKRLSTDQSSKGRKSRNKGSVHERKIVTFFSNWWTDEKDKNVFSKTPRSGAWKFPQDIIPPKGCPFLISCKNEEAWSNLESVLTADKHRFTVYWTELEDSISDIYGNETYFQDVVDVPLKCIIPMVVFTRNKMPDYIMIDEEHLWALRCYVGDEPIKNIKFKIKINEQMKKVVMMLLKDFLLWVSRDGINHYVKDAKTI